MAKLLRNTGCPKINETQKILLINILILTLWFVFFRRNNNYELQLAFQNHMAWKLKVASRNPILRYCVLPYSLTPGYFDILP